MCIRDRREKKGTTTTPRHPEAPFASGAHTLALVLVLALALALARPEIMIDVRRGTDGTVDTSGKGIRGEGGGAAAAAATATAEIEEEIGDETGETEIVTEMVGVEMTTTTAVTIGAVVTVEATHAAVSGMNIEAATTTTTIAKDMTTAAGATKAPACMTVRVRRTCLLYTSPSPRDATLSRMPSSA